jgi:hypothetical protein
MTPCGKRPKGMRVRDPLIHLPFRFGFSDGTLGQGGSLGRSPADQICLLERRIRVRQKAHSQMIRSPSPAGGYGASEDLFATSYWKIFPQMVARILPSVFGAGMTTKRGGSWRKSRVFGGQRNGRW